MKHKITALITMLFSGAILSAQMPGGITMQQASGPQGTTLGANTTSGAAGIALGNRVVMRGYVDFVSSTMTMLQSVPQIRGNKVKRLTPPQMLISYLISHHLRLNYISHSIRMM